MELRSAILRKTGKIVSMNGSYSEIEDFILENMGIIRSCRTAVKGDSGNIISELCMTDC
jgi:hypothetical protein